MASPNHYQPDNDSYHDDESDLEDDDSYDEDDEDDDGGKLGDEEDAKEVFAQNALINGSSIRQERACVIEAF